MTTSDHQWPRVTTSQVASKNVSDIIIWRKFKVIVRFFHQILTRPPNLANDTMFFHAYYVTFFICESEETFKRFSETNFTRGFDGIADKYLHVKVN